MRLPRVTARIRRCIALAGVGLLSVATVAAQNPTAASADTTTSRVIVTATSLTGALNSLVQVGLSPVLQLPLVNGVVADVTADQSAALSALPGVHVSPDLTVSIESGPPPTRAPAAVFPQSTGATALRANGINGHGVNVAVLDTGIDRLPDFNGRLVGGVDLTGEGNPFQDDYGHGTFVAGLIAGDGSSSGGAYVGEAPGAGLVAIKVAGASGATDMANVISGISWAVTNKVFLGISVLNLSLGAMPVESTVFNPLDKAVEAAWRSGIVVVASAGNAGPFNGTILSPGDDPLVITAGSIDDNGTSVTTDDTMTTFSSVGPTDIDGWLKPDVVTSGRSVVSERAPGSTVDTTWPSARIGTGNFVGSGTSFSAAITSGATAMVIQAARGQNLLGLSPPPDQVKARVLSSAKPGPIGNPFVDGHGTLNAWGASVQQNGSLFGILLGVQPVSLIQTAPTVAVAPNTTIDLHASWAASGWNPANWGGISWSVGPVMSGGSWNGGSWNSGTWDGSSWNGGSWNGGSWNGGSWNGGSWNGGSWNGGSWNGGSWNGGSWNGGSWNGGSWNGGSWNGVSWNGGSWNGGSWNSSDWS